MNCTSCGQSNAHDMAFCIYCGSSLRPGKPTARNLTLPGGKPCLACGKADTLNNQFCIFCGTKMESNGNSRTSEVPEEAVLDIEAPAPVQPQIGAVASPVSQGLRGRIVIGVLVGLLLGSLVGAGAAMLALPQPNAHALLKMPTEGLVVLTKKPRSEFLVTDKQRRNFIFGKTGAQGDIGIANLDAGDYKVSVENRITLPAALADKQLTLLAGPDGTELLEEDTPPVSQ